MIFIDQIKQLWEKCQLLQHKVEVGTIYCKIERDERKTKREQLVIIVKLLKTDEKWYANKVLGIAKENKSET